MKFKNPTSKEETDKIIKLAQDLFSKIDEDQIDDYREVIVQLASFAGAFNHNISREHRRQIIDLLAKIGYNAISGVLEAYLNCPRVEQEDVTIAFIRRLKNEEERTNSQS